VAYIPNLFYRDIAGDIFMNIRSKIKVLESLSHKAQSRAELKQTTGLSEVTIIIATRELVRSGLIKLYKVDKKFMYKITDIGEKLLQFKKYLLEED